MAGPVACGQGKDGHLFGQLEPMPPASEERQMGTLGAQEPQSYCRPGGGISLPILTRKSHSTAWRVKAPPVGTGAVLGRHTHTVLE